MKTQLALLRFALFCTAAVLTLTTGTSAFAQSKPAKSRIFGLRLPTVVVEAYSLTPPDFDGDETIALPNGSVVTTAVPTADASFTMPDGSLLVLPARANSDGTVIMPDGSTATRNADGSLTLANGTVIEAPTTAPSDKQG